MKNLLLVSLFALAFCSAALAQSYRPPTLLSLSSTTINASRTIQVIITPGSVAAPTVILHYSGPFDFRVSGIASGTPDRLGQVQVNIPLGPRAISGLHFDLVEVELADTEGNTVYQRGERPTNGDGLILRLFYSGAFSNGHSIALQNADFGPTSGQQFGGQGHAQNLSTRGFVGGDEQAMIVGIVVTGTKTFLFRAVGPGLAPFGVTGFVSDPKIELRDSTGRIIFTNDNWGADSFGTDVGSSMANVGAFALPAGSRDAALRATLGGGSYSIVITGVGGSTGVALAEAYELR